MLQMQYLPIVRAGDGHGHDQFENREVRQKRINCQEVILNGDSTIKYVDQGRFIGRSLKNSVHQTCVPSCLYIDHKNG